MSNWRDITFVCETNFLMSYCQMKDRLFCFLSTSFWKKKMEETSSLESVFRVQWLWFVEESCSLSRLTRDCKHEKLGVCVPFFGDATVHVLSSFASPSSCQFRRFIIAWMLQQLIWIQGKESLLKNKHILPLNSILGNVVFPEKRSLLCDSFSAKSLHYLK